MSKLTLVSLTTLFYLFASPSEASFHYCTGKVIDIITRATPEETQVRIENMQGWASLNYGDSGLSEMHERQFSMLLSAFMAEENVVIEFVSNETVTKCSDNHDHFPIRYVRVRK